MALDGTQWNETLPDNDTVANQIDDYHRDALMGIRSRMALEHVWPVSQTATNQAGFHNYISFQAQTAAPTLIAASGQVGGLYIGASSAGYPLTFINSASSTGFIPTLAVGTLGSIPICSSANPTGLIVLAGPTSTTANSYVLSSINDATGGVQAPSWVQTKGFGAWNPYATGTTPWAPATPYLAATDGFVVAIEASGGVLSMKTDSNNPPTTVRISMPASFQTVSATIPVRKGDYWQVDVGGGAATIYWLPLGV